MTDNAIDWAGKIKARRAAASLTDWKLLATELAEAYFAGVRDFEGVNLQGANLRNVYLLGANLPSADMSRVNLSGADMSRTYLRNANLSGADMYGVTLTGARHIASITGVGIDGRTIYAVTHTGGPMFHIGCFWGGYEAAKAEVTKKYSAPEYRRHLKSYLMALDMLVALLEAQNDGGE